MSYEELIQQLAEKSGIAPSAVRDVLQHLPDVLLRLQSDENVRTPLGVFRAVERKERSVRTPTTEGEITIQGQKVIKLRSGTRLRQDQ